MSNQRVAHEEGWMDSLDGHRDASEEGRRMVSSTSRRTNLNDREWMGCAEATMITSPKGREQKSETYTAPCDPSWIPKNRCATKKKYTYPYNVQRAVTRSIKKLKSHALP
jgi:hypothetical protein